MASAPPEIQAVSTEHSLRWRVGLVVGIAMVLILGCSLLISTLLVRHFFADLQDNLVRVRLERVATVFDLQAKSKIQLVRDSAEWDETYDFINGENPGYLARNYGPDVNSTNQDVILVFDANRTLLGAVQTQTETADAFQPPAGLDLASLSASSLLGKEPAAGMATDGGRILFLAAHPATRSDLSGPANGWLVFGTYMDGAKLQDTSSLAGAPLKIVRPPEDSGTSSDFVEVLLDKPSLGTLKGFYPPVLSRTGGSSNPAYRISIPSLTGGPDIVFESGLTMIVFKYAMMARNRIILLSFCFGAALLIITLVVMQRAFLKPLASLDREIQEISQAEGEPRFLSPRRKDEIGRLAESANRLLRRVFTEKSRAKEQEELMISILDSATEGVLALRALRDAGGRVADFRILLFNQYAENLFRVSAAQVLGKPLSEQFPVFFSAGIAERLLRVHHLRQPETFETHYEDKPVSGWFRISIAPWRDGVVMTCNDITERKIHEEELAASYAEVERFNAVMIGREQRIVEMKAEVNRLRQRLGLPSIYESPSDEI